MFNRLRTFSKVIQSIRDGSIIWSEIYLLWKSFVHSTYIYCMSSMSQLHFVLKVTWRREEIYRTQPSCFFLPSFWETLFKMCCPVYLLICSQRGPASSYDQDIQPWQLLAEAHFPDSQLRSLLTTPQADRAGFGLFLIFS